MLKVFFHKRIISLTESFFFSGNHRDELKIAVECFKIHHLLLVLRNKDVLRPFLKITITHKKRRKNVLMFSRRKKEEEESKLKESEQFRCLAFNHAESVDGNAPRRIPIHVKLGQPLLKCG